MQINDTQQLPTMLISVLCFIVVGSKSAMAEILIQKNDAGILEVFLLIDRNEIKAAQLAEQKHIDSGILVYAKTLEQDRNNHLNKTKQLAQELNSMAADNSSMEDLRTKGQQDFSTLTALDKTAFSQMYVADMIKDDTEVLNWIDKQGTRNEYVKKFLKESREQINMYLNKALIMQHHQTLGEI